MARRSQRVTVRNDAGSVTLQAGPFTLRPFEEKDIPAIFEAADDSFIPLITTVPNPCDDVAALTFIERQHERLRTGAGWSLAIAEGAGPALGQIGLWPLKQGRASIGYWVLPSGRGRGVAGRGAPGYFRVWPDALSSPGTVRRTWNEASWRTAEKVGFQREGLPRQYQEFGGIRRDLFLYSLLQGDLQAETGSAR